MPALHVSSDSQLLSSASLLFSFWLILLSPLFAFRTLPFLIRSIPCACCLFGDDCWCQCWNHRRNQVAFFRIFLLLHLFQVFFCRNYHHLVFLAFLAFLVFLHCLPFLLCLAFHLCLVFHFRLTYLLCLVFFCQIYYHLVSLFYQVFPSYPIFRLCLAFLFSHLPQAFCLSLLVCAVIFLGNLMEIFTRWSSIFYLQVLSFPLVSLLDLPQYPIHSPLFIPFLVVAFSANRCHLSACAPSFPLPCSFPWQSQAFLLHQPHFLLTLALAYPSCLVAALHISYPLNRRGDFILIIRVLFHAGLRKDKQDETEQQQISFHQSEIKQLIINQGRNIVYLRQALCVVGYFDMTESFQKEGIS